MPVRWEFRDSVLAVLLEGLYSNREIERAFNQAFADPRFGGRTRLLLDGRESEETLSSADLEWRISFMATWPDRGLFPRIALLVRVDQHRLADLAESVLKPSVIETLEIGVFASELEALAWLTR